MTTLGQVGTTFVLLRTGRQPGPCSTLSGTPVVAGQFGGGLEPIGAEKTATGYEVAWERQRQSILGLEHR